MMGKTDRGMDVRWLLRASRSVFAAGLAGCLIAGSALPPSASAYEFEKSFSYYADGQDLKTVLTGFARAQGLKAEFDDTVSGRVSGRFQKVSARNFLTAMGEAYGAGWYVLGTSIHFYASDRVRKDFLTVPSGSAEDLVNSLRRSGFIADELPVKINNDANMLTFVGPEPYLAQIRTAAAAYLAVQTEKIVMRVFPVKYAWADDITLQNMDQTVTVPGIASILRGMVMGQSVRGTTVSQQRRTAQSVESLGAPGLSRQNDSRSAPAPTQSTPVMQGSISIMADPRVNAVLVSDSAFRMPYYEEVIRELDKPVELVEIHAAIVDIDTNASRELGVNFSGRGTNGKWQGGGSLGASNSGSTDSAGNPVITTTSNAAGALLSTIYTHGTDFFMARINALEEKNAARMLGRPSVLTVDNVQAVLENTTTYYIPLKGQEAVDLYKVESGTVLRVTPHIIHEGGKTSIKLAVSVQDDQGDSSSGYQSIGGENSDAITVTPIKQTKINTQAMVEVGQSLLIGGYYYEQKSQASNGVPVLKDIPLLGALFRSNSTSGRQMERLILITPRLVTPGRTNVPARVDEPGFQQKATQNHFELIPLEEAEKAREETESSAAERGRK